MNPEYEKSEGPGWWVMALLVISLVLGLALLLLVGCQPLSPSVRSVEEVPFEMVKVASDQILMVTGDRSYRVLLNIPEQLPENEEFTVSGTVFDSDGPVSDEVRVHFDAGMPQHGHGLAIDVDTERSVKGEFLTPGVRFHMKGRWLLTVDIAERPHFERARDWVSAK